jgi:plastocyanin
MKHTRILTLVAALLLVAFAHHAFAGTITGKVTSKKKKYLPHALIYVDSVAGDFKPPKEHPVMDQSKLVFHPHILPVLAGTTVDFLNSDDVAHNVFSPDKSADKMNLGTWPKGEIKSFIFEKRCDKVCDAVMLCNVHPEMEAFVVIMQNPYHDIADDSGYFCIENVPAGNHTIKVWHPKRRAKAQNIEVPKEGTVEIEFALKR